METTYAMRREEQVTWALRTLYERHGYKKYRMSKFEAYDLYLENINFLKSRSIITFHDLEGRVLALKPDVTLSIVKNTHANRRSSEKFYYLENVYRLDKPSGAYREISQLGLEYLGVRDNYATGEVVRLALKTLKEISPDFRMQLSHVGFIQSLLSTMAIEGAGQRALVECIRKKNAHELSETALSLGVSPAAADMLGRAAALSGEFSQTLAEARALAITPGMTEALDELEAVYAVARLGDLQERITLDFSLLGDMEYYSGVAFQGYVCGVPRAVLTGGCYAALMKKFGHELDAIGFAVYLNELGQMDARDARPDVDVLLLYQPGDPLPRIARAVDQLLDKGLSVRCEMNVPDELRYGRAMTLREVEEDA